MPQRKIPCMLMRGGTSKGPYFDMRDLPADSAQRDKVLLKVMGSPDPRQIDGLGGTATVTSKVVMVAPSERHGIDVDYLFAQIGIADAIVDTAPPCGNMMAGVGPFAIERGMVAAVDPQTSVMIYNINTNSVIEAIVQTPAGQVEYEGDAAISGVPGKAAPLMMNLFGQAGGKTGKIFPSGKQRETIDNLEVTLIDAGTVMMLLKAESLGLEGREDQSFFRNRGDLMGKIESMRMEAGRRMGLGDVSDSVLPKVGLLSPACAGGALKSHYLTPHTLHAAHAVSGAICITTAAKIPGTVAADLAVVSDNLKETVVLEHPSGTIEIALELDRDNSGWTIKKAGTLRTVRKIMDGFVFVPETQTLPDNDRRHRTR